MAPRLVGGSSPHESMAAQHKARGPQPCLPAVFRPDRRRVVEPTAFFLLLGQPSELGVKGMIGRKERLLAMQDRWMAVAIWSRQWMWRVRSEITVSTSYPSSLNRVAASRGMFSSSLNFTC
jgi:hypothetical protein